MLSGFRSRSPWPITLALIGAGFFTIWARGDHAVAQDNNVALARAPAIRLQKFASGFSQPVYVANDGTSRLYVVEQGGRVKLIVDGESRSIPYLDISREVTKINETGLLSIAFHPDFLKNGKFYAYYSNGRDKSLHSVISEFTAPDPKAETVDPKTERVLLTIRKPYENHDGGQLQFGADGYLYTGAGDGGSGGDPANRAQNPEELLGKMIRIDVDHRDDGKPYAIPRDNPFVGQPGYRPEIWAVGMRNPWRFSFDRQTHELWAADVGQDRWEEIDVITRGGNYGWRIMEGVHPHHPIYNPPHTMPPIKDYPHVNNRRDMPDSTVVGNCIIGGYVYRGKAIPDLVGWYVYADYSNSWIAGLKYENGRITGDEYMVQRLRYRVSSFGEDSAGELYVCDHDLGNVYKIAAP